EHEAFEAAERRALQHAVRAGRLLEEVKQDLKRRFGHGHFGRWIKRHCRFGWRRGEEYMQAAKWVSANSREAAHLTYTEVLRRAARPRRSGSLSARFVVPPFTVLDARAGSWQQRKREWKTRGIRGEEGRPNDLIDYASLLGAPTPARLVARRPAPTGAHGAGTPPAARRRARGGARPVSGGGGAGTPAPPGRAVTGAATATPTPAPSQTPAGAPHPQK